jgi:hypothetical protein
LHSLAKMLFRNSFLAFISLSPLSVSSYQIHQSCVDKNVASIVRDGMTSAFEMADSAVRHLDQEPYDRDTADLVRRLFLAKSGQDVNDKGKMLKVRGIFRNIIEHYRTETPTSGNLKDQDVVRLFVCLFVCLLLSSVFECVFESKSSDLELYRSSIATIRVTWTKVNVTNCSESFTEIPVSCSDMHYYCDDKSHPNRATQVTGDEVIYRRQTCHNIGAEMVALMITDNPDAIVEEWNDHVRSYVTRTLPLPTVIMICPWFIDCKNFITKTLRRWLN